MTNRKLLCIVLFLAAVSAGAQPASPPLDLKFDFTSPPVASGYRSIAAGTPYTEAAGFGFESADASSSSKTLFSANVPEGNYNVKLLLGGVPVASTITVKAESGRLVLERLLIPAGEKIERTFTTNVRSSHLPKLPLNATGREEVSLDNFDRSNSRDWDDKLTIEVQGPPGSLRTLEITSAPDTPTIFLAGDSTVTDRNSGADVSWGQLLPRFFKPGIAIANHAQSGETLKSFATSLRLDKIFSQIKPGDYLFLQFGHNDSKIEWPQTYAEAETTYKAWLKVYIAEARRRGATPVLVTSMDRGDRSTGAPTHSLGLYPQAMQEVATEQKVALIDLYAASQKFYQSAGADAPGILADGTHSTAYGGYEFAKYIATTLRSDQSMGLNRFIDTDFKPLDPGHPDKAETLDLAKLFAGK